jgi:hypothetical protein
VPIGHFITAAKYKAYNRSKETRPPQISDSSNNHDPFAASPRVHDDPTKPTTIFATPKRNRTERSPVRDAGPAPRLDFSKSPSKKTVTVVASPSRVRQLAASRSFSPNRASPQKSKNPFSASDTPRTKAKKWMKGEEVIESPEKQRVKAKQGFLEAAAAVDDMSAEEEAIASSPVKPTGEGRRRQFVALFDEDEDDETPVPVPGPSQQQPQLKRSKSIFDSSASFKPPPGTTPPPPIKKRLSDSKFGINQPKRPRISEESPFTFRPEEDDEMDVDPAATTTTQLPGPKRKARPRKPKKGPTADDLLVKNGVDDASDDEDGDALDVGSYRSIPSTSKAHDADGTDSDSDSDRLFLRAYSEGREPDEEEEGERVDMADLPEHLRSLLDLQGASPTKKRALKRERETVRKLLQEPSWVRERRAKGLEDLEGGTASETEETGDDEWESEPEGWKDTGDGWMDEGDVAGL